MGVVGWCLGEVAQEEDKMMSPGFTITDRIAAALTKIERARGFLEAAKLSKAWVLQMANRALVLEAHHTTHIEGTRLTLEQAEKLMAGQPVPDADPDDARAIKADVLIKDHGLNDRQGSALRFLMENGKLTIQDYAALSPKANRRTLQRDLKELQDKGLIAARGATNRLEYKLL